MISKIIKVDVEVITLTETLTFLDITKTESYNCFIIHWMKKSKWNWKLISKQVKIYKSARKTKRANLTWLPLKILLCGHTWHDYPWLWVSLTWLLYNLRLDDVPGANFEKFTVRFRPIRKEIRSWMYNNNLMQKR